MNTGVYVEPSRMTVREYLEDWLAHAKTTVAAKTHERYAEIVRLHLAPALGHYALPKLQPLHIQRHYAEALCSGHLNGKGGLSAQTVLHHHRVLHKALDGAVRLLLLARNPTDAVDPPRPQQKQARAMDEDQSAALLAALNGSRLYTPTLVALTTGMRRGELLALAWKDTDLEAGSITVCRSLQQTNEGVSIKQPKSGRGRSVALPPMTVDALRTHKAEQSAERLMLGPGYVGNDLVFPKFDGRFWEPDSFTSIFAAAVKKSGLPRVNFHSTRHTHATILLKQGINPKIVSERLGHARIGTTLDVYSHVLPGMQAEAADRIGIALMAAINAHE
jgi:integrase